jgi:hypothetical protein
MGAIFIHMGCQIGEVDRKIDARRYLLPALSLQVPESTDSRDVMSQTGAGGVTSIKFVETYT